jgi:hypothetical protein
MEVDYSDSSLVSYSVEEPSPSPTMFQVPEIRMKGSSWYEPEPDRIVVTDLDSSEDEEEADEPIHPVISPALLERIRRRELSVPELPLQNEQALVLYQPLNKPSLSTAEAEEPRADTVVKNFVREEDMMDIEE